VIVPAFDEFAVLDPEDVDAGNRSFFTRRLDVTDMLVHLVLSLMRAGRLPVHEDNVLIGGDIYQFDLHVRSRLACISDELFHALNPRILWMQGRMVMVVIGEILMRNIEVAAQNFLVSVLKKPPTKGLVSSTDMRRAPFFGNDNDGEISRSLANVSGLDPDVQMRDVRGG
jgi:hypothetical protein